MVGMKGSKSLSKPSFKDFLIVSILCKRIFYPCFNAKKSQLDFLLSNSTKIAETQGLSTPGAEGTTPAPTRAHCDHQWPDTTQPLPKVELCSADGLYCEQRHTALFLSYGFTDVFRDEQEAEGVSQG